MYKTQIIPFLILVLTTVVAAYFIVGAGSYEPFVDALQKDKMQIQTPPSQEPVATSTATSAPIATITEPIIEPDPQPVVTDFFSCIDVTGIVLESYPRQCVFNGKTFVEQIQDLVTPGDAIELTVEVGPELVNCTGLWEQSCLQVDGSLFYDNITGFEHEVGFRYVLRIERTLRWGTTDPAEIPADAGIYEYKLLEVVSKTAEVAENNCVVAGCSSQLCISQEEAQAGGGISTCEFREEYACYRFSECKPQTDGQCGWTMTPEVTQCLENPPTLE